MTWTSRTKSDLIIEVWEKLDCESVGAAEVEAIETVVADVFGRGAVDSPMQIARAVADEGADLRHSEIMDLYVARMSHRPYEAALRDILNITRLDAALASIGKLENLRAKYRADSDREGLRLVRGTAVGAKLRATETADRPEIDSFERLIAGEIAAWLTVWLQTPDAFDDWVFLRTQTRDFIDTFGQMRNAK